MPRSRYWSSGHRKDRERHGCWSRVNRTRLETRKSHSGHAARQGGVFPSVCHSFVLCVLSSAGHSVDDVERLTLQWNHGPWSAILQVPADGPRCPERGLVLLNLGQANFRGTWKGAEGARGPGQTWYIALNEVPIRTATTHCSHCSPAPCFPVQAGTPLSDHPLSQRTLRLSEGDPLVPKHRSI